MKLAWLASVPVLAAALVLSGSLRRDDSRAAAPGGPQAGKASVAAGAGPDAPQESKAVRELVDAFVKAYNAKDAAAIAA
jgi:hypothetical protein